MRAAALLQRAACSVVTCHLQLFPFGPFDISLYCTFAEASLLHSTEFSRIIICEKISTGERT